MLERSKNNTTEFNDIRLFYHFIRSMLLSARLLNHCERFQGRSKTADRQTISNAFFVVPFEKKDGTNVQFEVTAETFMTSKRPIAPVIVNTLSAKDGLPDIFPVSQTASIPKVHFYDKQSAYRKYSFVSFPSLQVLSFYSTIFSAIKPSNKFSHPHTILLHYSNLDVKHLFETPVTSDQFESRAILKGFTVAASRAQNLYGASAKVLDSPIVVQVVQLDSKRIQFGMFQLNSLDFDSSDGVKNYWFSKPAMTIYEDCCYKDGRPSLSSYNFDVFRMMNVFYSN